MLVGLILSLFLLAPVLALSDNPTQAELENELKNIEQQIEQYSSELAVTQTQKATLANKIKQLQTKQKALSLQIKATTLKLGGLNTQISVVEKNIMANLLKEQKINDEIVSTLKQINSEDENFILALVSADGLSGVFNEIQNYIDLTLSLSDLEAQTRQIRAQLTDDQNKLEDQKTDVSNLLQIKSIQQLDLKSSLGEQNNLLVQTKGLEKNYQTMLSDSKKRATEIRNRIYDLFNTGKQINFGQAVDMAKWVSNLTGVRAAFLLAVLTQESNLGKNVGTCNRSGDPPEKSWKVIMKPDRDQEPFQKITWSHARNQLDGEEPWVRRSLFPPPGWVIVPRSVRSRANPQPILGISATRFWPRPSN